MLLVRFGPGDDPSRFTSDESPICKPHRLGANLSDFATDSAWDTIGGILLRRGSLGVPVRDLTSLGWVRLDGRAG